MRLNCDLCGGILTATGETDSAVCSNCGMEYGPERLQEKIAQFQEQQPAEPVIPQEPKEPAEPVVPVLPVEPEKPAEPVQTQQPDRQAEAAPAKGKPGLRRVIRWLAIFAALDIVVGVKVTGLVCLVVIALLIFFGKPWS